MRRTRQVLAVMLVATALCADRGAAALSSAAGGSAARAHATESADATSLTARLIRGLSRTLGTSADVVLARQPVGPGRAAPRGPAPLADQSSGTAHAPTSPFQFRLPPPAPGSTVLRA